MKLKIELNKVINGDCLEVMKNISDKSIDLIIADPPYNIGKDTWDKINNYMDWLMTILKEYERILKDNGSFYIFHSEIPIIADLMQRIKKETKFIFKQFIVWNKRFKETRNKGYLDGFVKINGLRNYQQMAEYILFYTFWDGIYDVNNFGSLRKYFYDMLCWIGETTNEKKEHEKVSKKVIIDKIGQRGDHCFRYSSAQWDLPTKETYQQLINVFGIDKWNGFRNYKDIQSEYKDFKNKKLYTFNNQKTHHSVWNYDFEKKQYNIALKPIDLIKNIIVHSSKENDIVLDSFLGQQQ